jgi:PAS domain S-box-containing protein
MSIRFKAALVFSGVWLALLVILGGRGTWIILENHRTMEANAVREENLREVSRLNAALEATATTVRDWSAWDDSYRFVEDLNPSFAESNLQDTVMMNINADFMAIYRSRDNRVVAARAADRRTAQPRVFPSDLEPLFDSGAPLSRAAVTGQVVKGFVLLANGPALVAAGPILTTNRNGPPRGVLLMGRYLDADLLRNLDRMDPHTLALITIDSDLMPTDLKGHVGALSTDTPLVVPIDEHRVAGYSLIEDLAGRPALIARTLMPRMIYQSGFHGARQLLIALVVAGLVVGGVFYFLLDRMILSRLSRLVKEMGGLESSHERRGVREDGHDELTLLARQINHMLSSLEVNQAALRESGERYKQMIETAREGVCIVSSTGAVIFSNPHLVDMLGVTGRGIVGRPATDFVFPEDLPVFKEQLARRIQGQVGQYELRLRREDGASIDVLVSSSPMRDRKGAHLGSFVMLTDISTRKRMENELRRLTAAVEQSPVSIVITDLKGNIQYVNPRFEEVTGYTSDEIQGENPRILKSGEMSAENYRELWETITSGRTWNGELHNRRKDGTLFWEIASISPIRDASDSITGYVAVKEEITARKDMEVRLRENEERFRAVTTSAQDAIVMIDAAGRATLWNPAAERLFGYSAEEMLGRDVHEFLAPPELRRAQSAAFPQWQRTGEGAAVGRTLELRANRKSGAEFPVEISLSSVRVGGEWHAVAIIRDISERKIIEAQLAQGQRMESIGQLAGGVAHDFNNILTVISCTIEDMRRLPGAGEAAQHLEEIETAASRAAELTRHLLAFGRRQVLKPTIMDLNAAIRQQRKMLLRVIRENIAINLNLAPDLLRVRADFSQILQTLMNLVVNARDAMPDGGRLDIATINLAFTNETVFHGVALPPGRYVLLTIADSGTGMAPEVRDRIFEPFFTTKGKEEGTGLGLATVHGIVTQSGGRIWVESEPGKGTTFGIALPGLEDLPELPPAPADSDTAGRAHGEVVLVVDDEAGILRIVKRALERHGYRVVVAHDGEEAAVVASTLERIDLLVTDIVMPKLGGLDLADRLREMRPNLPVLYISGHIDQLEKAQGRINKANFLAKPFSVKDLLARAGALLAEKQGHANDQR